MPPGPEATTIPSLVPNSIFPRRKVGCHHDQRADQRRRIISFLDPGEHGAAVVAAKTERKLQELLRLRHVLGRLDQRNAEIDFREFVEVDLAGQRLGDELGVRSWELEVL